jgi:oligopeptide transport system ATP-binding protein
MPQPEILLNVEGLSKAFRARRSVADLVARRRPRLVAVDDVSFTLRHREALGIVGESGSGKSTLAKCLVKLVDPDSGSMTFDDIDVMRARGRRLAEVRRAMQMIYQDPYSSLNPLMTIEQTVAEPGVVHGLVPSAERRAYAAELLELVGLPAAIAARRPSELSGGQRQRVAIARAMAAHPRLLIADEPVSSLDVSIQAQVLNVFEDLRSTERVGIVFIAHQLPVVAHVAERVLVMYLGRIVESGPTELVFNQPAHPYTAALLRSQPGRTRRGRPPVLKGEIPSPLNVPTGCRFRTRCPMAQEICAQVDPEPIELGGGQISRCHFADEVSARPTAAAARTSP